MKLLVGGFILMLLIYAVVTIATAVFTWMNNQADKKTKSRSLGRGYDSKNEYETRRVYHNGF